jgi:4-methylaminobutanoate oxidase (formaldehyde-forming)
MNKHIVIIGGGAVGLSTAYHLGKLGCPNVLLLERNELTSGTSWHAAGIVGPLRASQNLTDLAKYALQLVGEIEEETGQATGYKQTGGLWLTQSHDRITELKRVAAMGEMNDLHGEFMSPGEVGERFPMINHSDLAGAMYLDQDGQINPVDLCMALAKGARSRGVEIREHTGVSDIMVEHGIAQAVVTDAGEKIECDLVINCAGLWARTIGEMAGVNVPLHAVEHMYVVTEPIPELPQPWPVCRDMEGALYIKEDAGKLVLGVFEPNAKLWDHKSVDPKASYLVFEEDWNHIEPMMEAGINRIPRFESIGVSHFMTGPESFTPDTKQLMGRSAEVDNFFVAAGMNSLGIMSSPGVGKAMADWVVQGDSPMDLWEVDIMRFQPKDNELGFVRERTIEAVSNQFDMHWPLKQYKTGRNRTQSVWHEQMKKQGAVFGALAGWERPLWFAQEGEPEAMEYSYGDQCWWPVAERESRMLEKSGALFELSPFSKIFVEGPDATTALQWVCSNNIDVAVGKIVYTLMLNVRGGIEGELTVTRLDENQYLLTTASLTRLRDLRWVSRNTRQFEITIEDRTDEFSILGVMGPNSRALLSQLSDSSFETTDFPFGSSALVSINGAMVRASRLSFVGELGWELMIANGDACKTLDTILGSAKAHEMGMAGFVTMECCRLEKGYLHWGHEIGPEEHPGQAGIGFAVKPAKPGGFLGLEALKKLPERPQTSLVLFEARDARPLLLQDEPIFLDGKWIGRTTSGGMGFRTQKALCFGYIDSDCIPNINSSEAVDRQFEVRVAGEIFPIYVLTAAPYDPKGSKMKA